MLADIDQLLALNKLSEISPQQQAFESESLRFQQGLIKSTDENTPKYMPRNFWAFFDSELPLTNLNPQDVQKLMMVLKVTTLYGKMAIPDYKKSYEDLQFLSQLRVKAFSRMMRSTGGMQRERALQATQIHQVISNEPVQGRSGILQRVAGAFGGRK